jgi:O-succinylbenzoate synthase
VLRAAELFRIRLPLVAPFRSARSTVGVKDALLLRVETDRGTGWGECVAQADPAYAPDTIDTARLILRDVLLPAAFAGSTAAVRGHTAARAALEVALLDARLRAEGTSLASHLGATAPYVRAGVAIGLIDTVDELERLAAHYADAGYRRIKCKIAPEHDIGPLRVVRSTIGTDRVLAADANGAYDLDGARHMLHEADDLDLQFVEQPLTPDALAQHATLAKHATTPICLDEAITSATVASHAIEIGACSAISVKPGALGGLAEAVRVHDTCVHHRVDAVPGGMLETGVGRAVLVALAALPGFTETGDVSASERYFGPDGDITEPFVLEPEGLRVPTGPGIGVEPIPDRLARCTIAREMVTP